MKKRFNPGFMILQSGYDQGSSGGAGFGDPTNPEQNYCDPSGREYWYLTVKDDDVPADGYYYFDESGEPVAYDPASGELHPCP